MKKLRRRLLYGRLLLLKYDRPALERCPRRLAARGKWLTRAFSLLRCFLEMEDLAGAVEIIDQLKLAYSFGFARVNESLRLTVLLVACLKEKRVNMAAFLCDAFIPLIRGFSVEQMVTSFEQLTFISLVSAKNKQFFLCAKAAKLVLDFFEKNAVGLNEASKQPMVTTGFAALKRMGCLTVRRDSALFYEILTRTTALVGKYGLPVQDHELSALFIEWLHKAARNEQSDEMIQVLNELEQLLRCGRISATALLEVIREARNVAGTFSSNSLSPICSLLVEKLLSLAYLSQSLDCMLCAVECAGKVGYLVVYQRGFRQSFSLLLPLLDCGRKLFNDERKFGYSESSNGFRVKSLLYILKENLSIAEYAVRQEMTLTVGDFILWILQTWQEQATMGNSRKSIKLFSQLFYLYWCQVRCRQAKRSEDLCNEVMSPALLTAEQVQGLFK